MAEQRWRGEFHLATQQLTSGHGQGCDMRPPGNTLKVNIDGAFDAEEESGAIGAVVRDAEGGFLMATTRWLPDVGSALAAEAEAPCAGVQLIYTVTEGPAFWEHVGRDTDGGSLDERPSLAQPLQICKEEGKLWAASPVKQQPCILLIRKLNYSLPQTDRIRNVLHLCLIWTSQTARLKPNIFILGTLLTTTLDELPSSLKLACNLFEPSSSNPAGWVLRVRLSH
nr:unnamed protein product [Digitaria exilis]